MIPFLIRCSVYVSAGLLVGCAQARLDADANSAARHGIIKAMPIKLPDSREYSVSVPDFTGPGLEGTVVNIGRQAMMFMQSAVAQQPNGGRVTAHFVVPIKPDQMAGSVIIGGTDRYIALFRAKFGPDRPDSEILLAVSNASGPGQPAPVQIQIYRLQPQHFYGPPGTLGTDISAFVPALSWQTEGLYCTPFAAVANVFGVSLPKSLPEDGCYPKEPDAAK